MWSPSCDIFSQICSKVSNKSYFEELMNKQQQFFDIQPYKIDKLYAESAKKLYKQICFKYQISKELVSNPNIWHQNERKIFIWFVVCYFHQLGAQDPLEVKIRWEDFSQLFFSKSPQFLKFQFLNIIKVKKRIFWTPEEDALLSKATQQQGIGKWNEISKALYLNSKCEIFKSPKHCRQRWLNHLDKNKNKGKWSDQEDYKILMYVRENGKKWSKIVQVLKHTRTQHMIKNRFNSLLTKNCKNKKQKESETILKIIKILQKQLNILSIEQKLEKMNSSEIEENQFIQCLQQHHQISKQLPIPSSNKQNRNSDDDQNHKKQKFSIHTKPTLEISNFQTITLWNSFSNFCETYTSKNEELPTQHSNYTFLQENFQTLNSKVQLQEPNKIEFESVETSGGIHEGIKKIAYKVKPVFIIQHNV